MPGKLRTPQRFLLDTNIAIAILNKDKSITSKIVPEMAVYLPTIVLGELFFGAHHSNRVHDNLQEVKSFSRAFNVLPCTVGTAEAYARLRAYLLNKGRPIPENDMWIAAIAHQRELTLITRDAHFQNIEFLSILHW